MLITDSKPAMHDWTAFAITCRESVRRCLVQDTPNRRSRSVTKAAERVRQIAGPHEVGLVLEKSGCEFGAKLVGHNSGWTLSG